jgi:DNA polymerase-3 subunit beta
LPESDETGAKEIGLVAIIEGQEMEVALNVKLIQDGFEAITFKNVVNESKTHYTGSFSLHKRGGIFMCFDSQALL